MIHKRSIKITTADRWFSKYIRIRDAYDNGYCHCCTCGKVFFWKYIQAGHFVSRGKYATRFNEENVHAQCAYCNSQVGGKGKEWEHGEYIDTLYGNGTAKKLKNIGNIRGQKVSSFMLKDIADTYRQKTKDIAKKKGLELK